MSIRIIDDGREVPYLLKITGMSEAEKTYEGKVSAVRACEIGDDCDMTFAISNRLLYRNFVSTGFHVLPAWVQLFFPLDADPVRIAQRLGSWVKRDIRSIISKGLTYEITHDSYWFDEFYDKMYIPHIQARHGNTGIVRGRKRLRYYFDNGCIMLVKRGEKLLGGCLMMPVEDVLMWPFLGVIDGSREAIKEGGATALYWFVMNWAFESGFKSINFGHCRPFITDGVLRYKLKWGMRITNDDDAVRDIAIKVNPNSIQGKRFLAQNPFLHLHNEQLMVHTSGFIKDGN